MRKLLTAAFVIAETIILCLLLWCDGVDSYSLSYGSIALCFAYSLLFINKKADGALLCLGLLFTLLADTFLIILPDGNTYTGMSLFTVTQAIYVVRVLLYDDNNVLRFIQLALTAIFVATMLGAANSVMGENAQPLFVLSVAYFSVMAITTVFAFVNFKKNPLFAIGLVLYMCCDFVIGMQAIHGFAPFEAGSFAYKLTHTEINLQWTFYLPAQTLIALSGNKRGLR